MDYFRHLCKDQFLRKILQKADTIELKKHENICTWLCASIISQQLSTKVAKIIHGRFLDLYGEKEPSASQILDTPFEKLSGIGMSNSKVSYVKNVALFEIEHGLKPAFLDRMTNDEVRRYLLQIKGVGNWTVEMLLIFAMAREDVFSCGDLGIQKAMIELYSLSEHQTKELQNEMMAIAENWRPYRTFACLHLWKWKDSVNIRD